MFNSMYVIFKVQEQRVFDWLFSSFEGRVVAKLPFEPILWIRGLSHRNLSGDDFTDCSFIFLYVLCTMSIRQVIKFSMNSISSFWLMHLSLTFRMFKSCSDVRIILFFNVFQQCVNKILHHLFHFSRTLTSSKQSIWWLFLSAKSIITTLTVWEQTISEWIFLFIWEQTSEDEV